MTGTKDLSITILAATGPLTIATSSPLPNATIGKFYTLPFTAMGGAGPYSFTSSGALLALSYALIEGNSRGWKSPLIVTLLVVAAAGFVAFILVERRSASPMLQLSFFRNPTFSAANTVAAGIPTEL